MKIYTNYQGQTALEVASEIHASVNQGYGKDEVYPFRLHLSFVCGTIDRMFNLSPRWSKDEELFNILNASGAYHDLIEDCRIKYHDLIDDRRFWLDNRGIYTRKQKMYSRKKIADIVYALTETRGKNRSERYGYEYMKGIFETPHAWFVKMADTIANSAYSMIVNEPLIKMYQSDAPEMVRNIYNACKNNEDFDHVIFEYMLKELELYLSTKINL